MNTPNEALDIVNSPEEQTAEDTRTHVKIATEEGKGELVKLPVSDTVTKEQEQTEEVSEDPQTMLYRKIKETTDRGTLYGYAVDLDKIDGTLIKLIHLKKSEWMVKPRDKKNEISTELARAVMSQKRKLTNKAEKKRKSEEMKAWYLKKISTSADAMELEKIAYQLSRKGFIIKRNTGKSEWTIKDVKRKKGSEELVDAINAKRTELKEEAEKTSIAELARKWSR